MTAIAAELGRRLPAPTRERVQTTSNGVVVDKVTTYHPGFFRPGLKRRKHYEITTVTPSGKREVYRRLPASGPLKLVSLFLLPSSISQADVIALSSNLARRQLPRTQEKKV